MIIEAIKCVCPECGSDRFMAHLTGENIGKYDVKCFNCNTYFRSDELNYVKVINKQTNADYIRSMTDEELAWFIYTKTGCDHKCMHWKSKSCTNADTAKVCGEIWLDWLKQEVK